MAVSLDPKGCLGDSVVELGGELPAEKAWFRAWLEERLERGASVLLGRRTLTAMAAYADRLKKNYPQARWVVLSRSGPCLEQGLAFASGFGGPVLILGGMGIFREALEKGLPQTVWVARVPHLRGGDLFLPPEVWDRYRLTYSVQEKGFAVEEWGRFSVDHRVEPRIAATL